MRADRRTTEQKKTDRIAARAALLSEKARDAHPAQSAARRTKIPELFLPIAATAIG
jgi:hypothetical protein